MTHNSKRSRRDSNARPLASEAGLRTLPFSLGAERALPNRRAFGPFTEVAGVIDSDPLRSKPGVLAQKRHTDSTLALLRPLHLAVRP